jgi:hypothetical protein
MANLCYGQLYPSLFLENQLKSLLDPTNLPALKKAGYDLEYCIFTDDETLQTISRHPNFMALGGIADVHIVKLNWPPDSDRFASRYGLLIDMFHKVLPVAIEKDAWLSVWVADLVFAKHSLPKMLGHLERGHDAVLNVPIRSAADSVNPLLKRLPGAPDELALFEMAYQNLHHLWVASHWDAPMFSKFPYSMLWNSGTGLLAHHFGITPIVFKPSEALKEVEGVIDADVPSFFKNAYWCTDWTDAAVAGVEPLSNGHYPPFLQHHAEEQWVADWALKGTQPCQKDNLDRAMYYPTLAHFNDQLQADHARNITTRIKRSLNAKAQKDPG